MTFSDEPWPECGVARFLTLLDGPWATLIVRNLLAGPARFSELRNGLIGISAHTLSNRLRRFEEYGLVTRTVFAEVPPRVVYELTESGQRLRPVLEAMNHWALTIPRTEGLDELRGSGANERA
ncbi:MULTISPECIES: winged helix-turn-helix transcriptional regulator [unclassified Microbacterium]|uniref:winged helix-turn-helix transcriptional regulator n=1 Tax=unclassified Microbacterium TaxID=2609290 RepID=UPI00177BAB66|nr:MULTISPECIES: helix-turn-helix domain-containing protein [unclassified Microbacterium]MBD8207817.1 helix-turn-helix transcriptional regulator [Microbacterium sp. CFBP 8801]MBD8478043.1 helix-turn-helix transcriptional regulator [Microbacterium sp. CFBP 8794]MBD8508696.1 helix-turn-helix transcriptional regulator [Microbacterium sp. CFBP 8790]